MDDGTPKVEAPKNMLQGAAHPLAGRVSRVRRSLERLRLDAFLLTNLRNIRYLSGFSGSSAIALVTSSAAFLITDFRYRLQAAQEVHGFELLEQKGSWEKFLSEFLPGLGLRHLGFESNTPFIFVRKLRRMARPALVKPVDGLVEKVRVIKDEAEIAVMEELIRAGREAFASFVQWLQPGVSEQEAALELEYRLRKKGSDAPPFTLIVASGANAAMPHARTSGRIIGKAEPVIIDFGASAQGYATDMTRTICLGTPPGDIANAYRLVYDAQASAIAAIHSGAKASEVDAAARQVISGGGMGSLFGHATGHGVGLDVHEPPGLSPESRDVLRPGMVVTVEPGVYLEGRGGVRIEDMVLVTADGHRVLSAGLPKPTDLGRIR